MYIITEEHIQTECSGVYYRAHTTEFYRNEHNTRQYSIIHHICLDAPVAQNSLVVLVRSLHGPGWRAPRLFTISRVLGLVTVWWCASASPVYSRYINTVLGICPCDVVGRARNKPPARIAGDVAETTPRWIDRRLTFLCKEVM